MAEKGTEFQRAVWKAAARIPRGKVSTYSLIAKAVGKPRALRAVGSALNANPYAPKVPCHRVVKGDGSLGGFASGPQKKKAMLEREEVRFSGGKIDLKEFGCAP